MRSLVLFLFLLSISQAAQAQTKDNFFNEMNIILNHSFPPKDSTTGKTGFGVSLMGSFFKERQFNINMGLCYINTSQFREYEPENATKYHTNITYLIHSFSVPATFRLNFGKRFRFFIDAGAYLDINVSTLRKSVTYNPELPVIQQQPELSKERINLSPLNYGPLAGFGIRIPVKTNDFLFRIEYKYGIQNIYKDHTPIYNRYLACILGFRF